MSYCVDVYKFIYRDFFDIRFCFIFIFCLVLRIIDFSVIRKFENFIRCYIKCIDEVIRGEINS